MGRRTLSNPQFKDRRGVDLRAQVFALRRALAVKAQLVKNQQRQIDLLGRELANACIRIGVLEQHKARSEAAWERIAASFSLVAEYTDLAPPSDGVFDERLHPHDDINQLLDVAHNRIKAQAEELTNWGAQRKSIQETMTRLVSETLRRTAPGALVSRRGSLRGRLAALRGRLAAWRRRLWKGAPS